MKVDKRPRKIIAFLEVSARLTKFRSQSLGRHLVGSHKSTKGPWVLFYPDQTRVPSVRKEVEGVVWHWLPEPGTA